MKIAEKIYELRTEHNMSQGDLAEKVDVSRQSISKWETGSAVPDLDKLIKLSGVFGVTLDKLVGNDSAIKTDENAPKLMTQEQVDAIVADIKKEYSSKTPILHALLTILGGAFILMGSIYAAISSFKLITISLFYIEIGLILIGISNKKVINFIWRAVSITTCLLVASSLAPNVFVASSVSSSVNSLSDNFSFFGLTVLVLYIIMCAVAIYNKKGKFEKLLCFSLCVINLQLANVIQKIYWLIYFLSRYYDENYLMVRVESEMIAHVVSAVGAFVVLLLMGAGVFVGRRVYLKKKTLITA